ncbi:MAG: N-formylglutamate amidohydrolase [Chitinivibrionales bacterium]|nr:N-formylglutamate amidohydrolase [Chitinivibrionales bacterium]
MKLPVLITIPHGGTSVPPEINDHIALTPEDILKDGDAFTREIYDLRNNAVDTIISETARAIIDVNRAPDDFPPGNPDGVLKSVTCYNKSVYLPGKTPESKTADLLLKRYYASFHRKINNSLARNKELKLGLDCHSMAAFAPPISPDRQSPRPAICLGNRRGQSCPFPLVEKLRERLSDAFAVSKNDIRINDPFAGGYIIGTYGNEPIPWIQIELNRNLYMTLPSKEGEKILQDNTRIQDVNRKLNQGLQSFFRSCGL